MAQIIDSGGREAGGIGECNDSHAGHVGKQTGANRADDQTVVVDRCDPQVGPLILPADNNAVGNRFPNSRASIVPADDVHHSLVDRRSLIVRLVDLVGPAPVDTPIPVAGRAEIGERRVGKEC